MPTLLLLFAGSFQGAARAQSNGPNDLRVHFVGLSSDKGRAACIIFRSADGWPSERSKAAGRVRGPISNGEGLCDFKGLPAGTYAIAALDDDDGTGKMRYNMLHLPQKAYGFSNDAKPSIVKMSAPAFDDAAFPYPGGTMDLTIHAQ